LIPGLTCSISVSDTTRTPRPFICSKKFFDATLRMKKTISSGLSRLSAGLCG
jgi:hypothetical protein